MARIKHCVTNGPVVVIYLNYGPYHIARLRALSGILSGTIGIEVAQEQKLYPWRSAKDNLGFESRTLFHKPFEQISALEQKNAVTRVLDELGPSVVIVVGYNTPAMRAAAVWARRVRKTCIMIAETTWFDKRRYWPIEMAKAVWCRTYYDSLCLPGERSVQYFSQLHFPKSLIWRTGNVVDNNFFCEQSDLIKKNSERERQARELPEKYFLAVNRLSDEKNLFGLAEAFEKYRFKGGDWSLVVVGGGPKEADLNRVIEQRKINGIVLVSWKQYLELPAYYALASCFILASTSEPWGLVANEAMACGLPLLVSRYCGCVPELCRRGINGYDFDPYDSESLAALMLKFSGGKYDLKLMSEASRNIIACFTPESWASSLRDCIEVSLARANEKR